MTSTPVVLQFGAWSGTPPTSPNDLWRINGPWIGTDGNTMLPGDAQLLSGYAGADDGKVLALTVQPNEKDGAELQSLPLGTFGYGYYEASMKVTQVPGAVVSFFTIQAPGYGPQEIDIEFLTNEAGFASSASHVHYTLHPSGMTFDQPLSFNPTTGFHRYGFLWTPGEVQFTVDGTVTHTFTDPQLVLTPGTSEFVMANTWTGNPNWGGGPPTQAATSEYEWIKYYPNVTTVPSETESNVPCFAYGTLLATARGELSIETLAVGDHVTTRRGERPIVWIGQRQVNCRTHPHPERVWPIRIQAGAFGLEKPRRDLVLSPGHSVFCDGVLIPVEHLINGATVVQEQVASAHYFHVELDGHDIVFANGLPTESYLDDGNRAAFENGAAELTLHPDFISRSWDNACAPRRTEGGELTAARRLLHDRALALGYRVDGNADIRVLADGVARPPSTVIAMHGKFVRYNITLYRFALMAGTRAVRIVSAAGVPAWNDPASVDQRRIGVRIAALHLNERSIPLTSRLLAAGFYPIERRAGECWRWTNGDAHLDLPRPSSFAVTLDLFVRDTMQRWVAPARATARLHA